MKLNPKKNQSMIVSRSLTENPLIPVFKIDGRELAACKFFKIPCLTFDNKLTFEMHIRNIASGISKRIGILQKCCKIFGDEPFMLNYFNCFILPCLEYCALVRASATESHLKLLVMLYKIYNSPNPPLPPPLPGSY